MDCEAAISFGVILYVFVKCNWVQASILTGCLGTRRAFAINLFLPFKVLQPYMHSSLTLVIRSAVYIKFSPQIKVCNGKLFSYS